MTKPVSGRVARNRRALRRGVDAAIAGKLGCSAEDDVLALLVDRELAQVGLLPPEALRELTVQQRAVVLAGTSEEAASANVAAFNAAHSKDADPA